MAPPAIEARSLTKSFERRPERGLLATLRPKGRKAEPVTAVGGVDLTVERGEFFGLLGPNGAGKTTLVKLLSTLLVPSDGSATVAGHDVEREPEAVRRKVGVVLGGERALYWRLTGRENLWYFSQLYNIPSRTANARIDELLAKVGLTDRADERVENYSKGMKQRLHVARGLLNDPEVLLLDEPTIGLDPHAARSVRDLVRGLATNEGRTVVLTTHYLYEADELSDRVGIMNRGRIVALDAPGALKQRFRDRRVHRLEVRAPSADFDKRLANVEGVVRVTEAGENTERGTRRYHVQAGSDVDGLAGDLARAVEASGARLVGLHEEEPTLEDVFIDLTGENLSQGDPPRG